MIDVEFDTLTMAHQPETSRLVAALRSEDDIGAVIRCHFEVERAAEHALEVITQGRFKVARANYLSEKLNLLEILGAPQAFLGAARLMNKHRNGLAHRGVDQITAEQEAEYSAAVRRVFPQYGEDFRLRATKGTDWSFEKIYADCSVRERYVWSTGFVIVMVGELPQFMAKYFATAAQRQE
ncbi:hypothetical protein LB553_08845 [Mesorhizobium sp. CA8]|uniref:hypothetical protein n=1 Tax=Mesorhizobium sp. CA8 TaxID=2876637 RepID=UPI001CCF89A2|nr:hypothetical protein [Mesorhizobium sp. CA8]MBZ9760983.1 hypothetical protein [Mesorhizobium sp. CA8]